MKASTFLFVMLSAALAAPAFADEAAVPAKLTACAACHGANGVSQQPIYPHLAGQYANYLEHAMKEYRSGVRKDPVMGAQAKGLTDTEIRELAAHFAAQPGPLYTPGLPQ